MSKLKVYIKAVGTTVFYAVLEQDEALRRKPDATFLVRIMSNGITIKSATFPKVSPDLLALRGVANGYDSQVCRLVFASHDEAEAFIKRAKEALKEFAATGYFNAPEYPPPSYYDIVEV